MVEGTNNRVQSLAGQQTCKQRVVINVTNKALAWGCEGTDHASLGSLLSVNMTL